ncbi:MAG: mandelate racemase/muconate lactonizing enzyme family protein [Burkholderiaceae bacterium]|nr:MAG: mandelate racemase/muconate lactonizing enzyme family protein [Burkholderiaceae bacterium]
MKIINIENIPIQMPLKKTYRGSHYYMTHRCTIITRIYTDEGIIGECYNGDEFETQSEIINIIQKEIKPQVLGMDIFSSERIWQAMLPPTYNILRDRKLATNAMACVDSAVLDAWGKALNQPLFKLWGGYRDELPIIAIAGYYEEGKKLADFGTEMEKLREAGLGGCKFKVGGRSPEEDAERVQVARKAVGNDFILTVDANQGFTQREAIRFGRLVQDCNVRWFEEPCRWYNDRSSMALVRNVTGIPVAAGQSEYHRGGCRDLFESGSVDVCNFDASWGGGPTEWRRVAAMALSYEVQMGHHEEPQVSAQLLASIPHGTMVEVFHPDRDPLFYALFANHSKFDHGKYKVPTGPGWGLELDQDVIKKYRVDK